MAKLKVPDDVAVLGIGNDPLICEHTVPQLSSVVPRFEDEGYRAARELQAMMISGRTPQRREITFGAQGVEERKSTARTQQGGALVQRGLAFIAKNVLSGITVSDVGAISSAVTSAFRCATTAPGPSKFHLTYWS